MSRAPMRLAMIGRGWTRQDELPADTLLEFLRWCLEQGYWVDAMPHGKGYRIWNLRDERSIIVTHWRQQFRCWRVASRHGHMLHARLRDAEEYLREGRE